MAQKVQVILVDDIDGGVATETVSFSLDGSTYDIDLSAENATRLREAFAPYVGQARRAGRPSATRARRSTAAARPGNNDNAAIRAWAKENGRPVSERGRISGEIRDAYEQAHA
jgi:hypothetical protein